MTNDFHTSKGCGVTLRKGIFRVFKQYSFDLPRMFEQDSVDFIPVGAMGNEFPSDRCGGSFIHFIHGNQQPLAAKSFFNFSDLFSSHGYHLERNTNIRKKGIQDSFRGRVLEIAVLDDKNGEK